MTPAGRLDFRKLLGALTLSRVDFVVVGGVSALLQGAPITTLDLDVVHSREAENIERLGVVLAEVNAIYRTRPELRRRPSAEGLAGDGHHLLVTDCGPLDVLGKLVSGQTYPDLVSACERLTLDGHELCVQDLEGLIRIKELLDSPKDRAALPVLRSTLDEKRRRES